VVRALERARKDWRPLIAGIAACVLGIAASIFTASWPGMLADNGTWGAVLLSVPVLLALSGLLAIVKGWRRTTITIAFVYLAFCLVSIEAIGFVYLPSAAALLLAHDL